MFIWSRVGAVLVLLALPLALAVGSQALAERPGSPPVPDEPVQLLDAQPTDGRSSSPSTPTDTPSEPSSDATLEGSSPRVVTPSPEVSVGSAGDDEDDGDGGAENDD